MTHTTKQDWIVTLDPHQTSDAVVSQLGQLGLIVGQIMTAAGVIVVHGTFKQANQARNVPGVVDVSMDQPIDIGPPDAEIS
jgi:hypothetical protein